MIITDFHMHSALGGDANDTLEDMFLSAIENGCKYIAVTEHCNNDFLNNGFHSMLTTDLDNYRKVFASLKKKYEKQVTSAYGIEIGYDAKSLDQNAALVKKYDYDYIINSIHIIRGTDCYWERYFEKRTQKEGYTNYLNAVYDSLSVPYRFNTIGHLGYITRNSPFENRDMLADYRDLVAAILKKMIKMDICLELNTNIRSAPKPCLPQKEIIKLYKDLGGELVIYGSDAHSVNEICKSRNEVMSLLKDCGFKYHCVFVGKELKLLPI